MMKTTTLLALTLLLITPLLPGCSTTNIPSTPSIKPRLAATPPMGWNSWEAFRREFTEDSIKEQADAMVSTGLRDAGYTYLVIDGGWKPGTRGPNNLLIEDPAKFPHGMKALADYVHSKGLKFGLHQPAGIHDCPKLSPGSQGFEEADAALFIKWGVDFIKYDRCDYVHAKDTTSGAPDIDRIVLRQGTTELFSTEAEAVQNHLTGLARVEPRDTCSGGHCVTAIGYDNGALTIPDISVPADGKYSLDLYLSFPYFGMERYNTVTLFVTANGSSPHRIQLPYDMAQRYTLHKTTLELTLKKGSNSITLNNPHSQEDEIRHSYLKMAHALEKSDHPIMFSVCTVPRPWLWCQPIAHLFRCETDVNDHWTGNNGAILPILDRHIPLLTYTSPEFWPDPDMLEVGHKDPVGRPNASNPSMTHNEYQAQFSLWAIMNAPLFISMDLRHLDDSTKSLLLNKDVIAINQDPLASPCRCIRSAGDIQIFAKSLADGSTAVAFLNRSPKPATVQIPFSELGIQSPHPTSKDLWTGQTIPLSSPLLQTSVPTHAVVLLRIK